RRTSRRPRTAGRRATRPRAPPMKTRCSAPGTCAGRSASRFRPPRGRVVDQLRLFWNRPLSDGDRPRRFLIAVGLIAAAAGAAARGGVLARRAGPAGAPAPEIPRRVEPPVAPVATTAAAPVPTVQPSAPSEEGRPAAGSDATPAEIAAAKHGARTFLAGYLPF